MCYHLVLGLEDKRLVIDESNKGLVVKAWFHFNYHPPESGGRWGLLGVAHSVMLNPCRRVQSRDSCSKHGNRLFAFQG